MTHFDPPAPIPRLPRSAAIATYGSLGLGAYCAGMSVVSALVGSFVGPQGFVAGGIYLALAIPMIVGGRGLTGREPWARWVVAVTSLVGIAAIGLAIAIVGLPDRPSTVMAGLAVALLAALGIASSLPGTVAWCRRG